MASILIERLMGVPFVLENLKIPVHTFFAAQNEVIAGRLTRAQIKNYLAMDTDTATEYDVLANKAPGQIANRTEWVNGIHAVFLLAESRVPGYDTPTAVRTKLGI